MQSFKKLVGVSQIFGYDILCDLLMFTVSYWRSEVNARYPILTGEANPCLLTTSTKKIRKISFLEFS